MVTEVPETSTDRERIQKRKKTSPATDVAGPTAFTFQEILTHGEDGFFAYG
jgi:hypothetical protein